MSDLSRGIDDRSIGVKPAAEAAHDARIGVTTRPRKRRSPNEFCEIDSCVFHSRAVSPDLARTAINAATEMVQFALRSLVQFALHAVTPPKRKPDFVALRDNGCRYT